MKIPQSRLLVAMTCRSWIWRPRYDSYTQSTKDEIQA